VTWLEPRTPHQPEKLKKVSKNDYVFTPSIFRVNKNCAILSGLFSIECSEFTGGCQNLVQPLRKQGSKEIFGSVFCLLNEVRECERGLRVYRGLCISSENRSQQWISLDSI
jgi:hypothetical protein